MELTKEEAIELLNERFMTMSMCVDKEYCANQNAALDMAISALKTDFGTKESYNLINQQKAEIERLNLELQTMRGTANSFKMHYNTARAEGIKEFVERLKEYSFYSGMYGKVITIDIVKQIAKEMPGEPKSEDAGNRIYDDFMKACKL